MEVWRHFFLGSELTSCWGPLAGLKVRETKRIADEELVERTGATHVGVELDASHLFWQRMDPVAVVQDLGPLTFHAAAKDVKINPAAAVYGVLDNRFRRLSPEEPRTNLGGDEWANEWPKDAAWDFVALGRGHDAVYWSTWLSALYAVDPDMWVNIEHEDVSLGRIEGLEIARMSPRRT
ncbi:MAG: sugar phosphate isomerase/epimerase family protein [Propionibacteriaceae bacterium]